MESTLPFHQRLLSIKSFQDPQLICWNRTQIVFFQVELVVLLHSVPVLLFRKLKQSFVDVIQDSCSWKICNIHSEKSVLVSLFIEGAGLTSTKKTLQHRYFSVNIAKEHLFQQNTYVGCFWVNCDYSCSYDLQSFIFVPGKQAMTWSVSTNKESIYDLNKKNVIVIYLLEI